MGRKIVSIFLIVYVFFLMPMTSFAQTVDFDRKGSISLTLIDRDGNTPITGAELSLYHVATASLNSKNNLSYTFTNAFEGCSDNLDDPTLSVKLDAFVEEYSVSAEKFVTDAHGRAVFPYLPLGLYFVKQTNTVEGYAPCTSFLVTVPNQSADGYVYDVNASPKTDVSKHIDITIKKVWNTGKGSQATESITVQLLENATLIETAVLTAQNNWQVTYTDMPESDAYSIVEVGVPKGFTATYSKSGYVFIVTNTSTLAQTGQLLWPIPVLSLTGLFLVAVGIIILRKSRNENA